MEKDEHHKDCKSDGLDWWCVPGCPVQGKRYTIGVDEVGYGAWAGPVYVCAVAVPHTWSYPELTDSKKLSKAKISSMQYGLRQAVTDHVILSAEAPEIDDEGVGSVLKRLQTDAAKKLLERFPGARVMVDGKTPLKVPNCQALPKADSLVQAVSAASVLAKHARDTVMRKLARTYPQYGFERHVGYGTPGHRAVIEEHGMCALHRRSYRPMRDLVNAPRVKHSKGPSFGDL